MLKANYQIRLEQPEDYKEVENLTREAFWNVYRPGCEEHLVLHNLRNSRGFIKELDYVVTDDSKIIGNIVYSKSFVVENKHKKTEVVTFGPISVLPEYQKQGIGKLMISYTAAIARKLGYGAIVITGNDHYYHPLGFVSASRYGIHLEGIPKEEEAVFFMAKELKEGFLANCRGICEFNPCFEVKKEELEAFDQLFPPKKKRRPRSTDLS